MFYSAHRKPAHGWMLGIAAYILMMLEPTVAGAQNQLAVEQKRLQCVDWLLTGYPSGIVEKSCSSNFNLPSPFLFVCANAQRHGYESVRQRRACGLYLAKAAAETNAGIIKN